MAKGERPKMLTSKLEQTKNKDPEIKPGLLPMIEPMRFQMKKKK